MLREDAVFRAEEWESKTGNYEGMLEYRPEPEGFEEHYEPIKHPEEWEEFDYNPYNIEKILNIKGKKEGQIREGEGIWPLAWLETYADTGMYFMQVAEALTAYTLECIEEAVERGPEFCESNNINYEEMVKLKKEFETVHTVKIKYKVS